ncbi:glycerophosphodiester phosphodiesterase [Actinacidiphila acidipaludis]|uniref:Glycerophosphodiester phosphodiesterase n=1 Tax=Actinacidiphila acidipaludis TaxID=2873382 RepID=A0ABS7QAS5_9ACTN|nr:glycerophosphodiester phosphodiesterase [Streptomyces acidipaludis]MBY8880221.1 glycerophosphodiester phosphodiesterase [Streptomyces acidipaludis]
MTTPTPPLWTLLENQPGPRWIAHRGGSLLAPENTIEALRAADQLGADAAEMDVYVVADGGLMVMHDGTVDRTTNLTGTQSTALTVPAALRGRVDAGSWFCNTWPSDLRIPVFADVCADIAPRLPLIVHCNNHGSGNPAVAEIVRQDLGGRVLVMGWWESELVAARAAGIPSLLLCPDGTPPAGQTWNGLLAAGTAYVGVDYTQTSAATITSLAAAGLRVMVYTVNSRTDYAALPKDGSVWAVISDDPWYVRGTAPMRTKDLFSAGTFFHGMSAPTDLVDYRGSFTPGATSWWGLDGTRADVTADNDSYASCRHGYLGPLASTFTVDTDLVFDSASSGTASAQLTLTVGDVPYDDHPSGSSTAANGYNVLLRQSGVIDVYKVAAGTPTKVGTVTTAAVTIGAVQHLRVQVTATSLIVTRTNAATPNSVTVSDATYRGTMYPHLGVRHASTRWSALTIS